MSPVDRDELRRLMEAANVTPERPLDLYCAHGETDILQNHTVFGGHTDEDYGPCRITTGTEFDEETMARYVIAAANAVPHLLAAPELLAADTLSAAWAAAEAALPVGWSLLIGDERKRGRAGWWATASEPYDEGKRGFRIVSSSEGSTLYDSPAAALRELAAALGRATSSEGLQADET